MVDRFEIAANLREIARLLTLMGENPFKAQAYERGARSLEKLGGDFDALVASRRLTQIPGIGTALASLIEEIYRTGESWMLQRMRQELPPGALELSVLPGLTLKKINALHDALHIESIAELKTACAEGLVSHVKGFGKKSEAKLLADIEKLENRSAGSVLLHHALEEAERILQHLRSCPDLIAADAAGALRRRRETVNKITIVAASEKARAVLDRFIGYPALSRTDALEDSRCAARLAGGLQAEVLVVKPDQYVIALHARTGSSRHLAKLQKLAAPKNPKQTSVTSEEDLYRQLGLAYIAPELREDEGEIEAAKAGSLPRPIVLEEIRGMTHCHTVYSDGRNSIEEMALAAEAMGMQYLTITDHSASAYYARGVTIDRLRAQWEEIDRVQERVRIKLLRGTESDILEDGSLDYPDHILERFDIIIASIHSRHKMDSDQMTARLLRALSSPFFKIWGHPLGRLIQSRPPLECRMEEVLDAAARSRCAIEVNGDPHRLDLEPRWIRAARERGIKFLVSTDAHSTTGMQALQYGIAMARRGWLTRGEVLNTLDSGEFKEAVHP
ncbi:MAG TPA: PHP domain-containing protein [Candidatus Binatia bacterium]|nr:PHP domain-containing protein [Candidatus Binatia bacterium]